VAAARLGAVGRRPRGDAAGSLQLLDRRVLRGRGGSHRRRTRPRRTASRNALGADSRWALDGAGAAILANSRPYEGMLVCVPAVLALLWWGASKARQAPAVLLRRAMAPVALLLLVVAMDGYYNHRVFGDAFTLPYQVNRATYASAPVYIWQQPRPEPVYRHMVMREFYTNWELRDFLRARTPAGFLEGTARKLGIVAFFFFGIALLPPSSCCLEWSATGGLVFWSPPPPSSEPVCA